MNESLLDTSRVISSMTSCMVARVGPHQHVLDLAKYSSVPVINALSDRHHPMQAVADLLTMFETRQLNHDWEASLASMQEMFKDMRIAWVGDANNVLFDLAIAATRLGMHIAVATPKGYEIPEDIRLEIERPHVTSERPAGTLLQTTDPAEAVHNADFVVTDTWVSMGQEENKTKRLRDFEGFQVTSELLARGGARGDCRFMHCMPRHPEEVSDELFYGPRSLVFQEAENRLWAAMGESLPRASVLLIDVDFIVPFPLPISLMADSQQGRLVNWQDSGHSRSSGRGRADGQATYCAEPITIDMISHSTSRSGRASIRTQEKRPPKGLRRDRRVP